MCIAEVWDLQTISFEIPWFLGPIVFQSFLVKIGVPLNTYWGQKPLEVPKTLPKPKVFGGFWKTRNIYSTSTGWRAIPCSRPFGRGPTSWSLGDKNQPESLGPSLVWHCLGGWFSFASVLPGGCPPFFIFRGHCFNSYQATKALWLKAATTLNSAAAEKIDLRLAQRFYI